MNQQAIYRSIWADCTIETNCEVTPEGEIVNVEVVATPHDIEHLESEEVELVARSKSYNIVYDEDNNPLIEDADTSVQFQALLLDGIFFPSTLGPVSFSGYGVYDGLTESWVESSSQPGKPYTSSADIGSEDPSGVYAFMDTAVLSTYSRLDSEVDVIEPKVIVLDVFGIEITLTGDDGGSITSTLKEGDDGYDHVIDGIESMILAHAIAGINVKSPAYLEGIETAVLSAANNIPDEDTEMKTITLSDFSSSDSEAFTEVISEKLSDMDIECKSFSYCIDVDVLLATS